MVSQMEKIERIEFLKDRAKHCVCKYCGGRLEVRQIIFYDQKEARIELYCTECNRMEYGVEKEIFKSAKYFVEEMAFNHYPDLDDNEKTKQMNIAKVSEILNWGCKTMGVLDDNGFKVSVKMDEELLGKSIVLDEDSLLKLLQEMEL